MPLGNVASGRACQLQTWITTCKPAPAAAARSWLEGPGPQNQAHLPPCCRMRALPPARYQVRTVAALVVHCFQRGHSRLTWAKLDGSIDMSILVERGVIRQAACLVGPYRLGCFLQRLQLGFGLCKVALSTLLLAGSRARFLRSKDGHCTPRSRGHAALHTCLIRKASSSLSNSLVLLTCSCTSASSLCVAKVQASTRYTTTRSVRCGRPLDVLSGRR